jgi:hypothetical protein
VRRFVLFAIAAAMSLCLAADRDWAQNNEVNVQFHTFEDTRSATILSPTVDLEKDFTDRTSLRVNFGVDLISAASDSCARCHRNGVSSSHESGGLSVTEKFGDLKVTAGGAYSQETFYRATTALGSVSRNLANGNTTIAGGYSFSLNRPELHPLRSSRNQYSSDAYGSITQTMTRTTIGQVGYELAHLSGYMDNPFLRADVNGVMMLGHVPDARTRQTITARLRQALPADTYLEADYRRYFDDWKIKSNALSVGVSHHFTPVVSGSVGYRWYDQTGAYFYQPVYIAAAPQFFTGDFRLEPFTSTLYTGKVIITPPGRILGLPQGSGLSLQYDRYVADNGFQAAIFSAGIRLPLGAK